MSVKVLMPSDRVRMSPETYREYAISYKSLAALLRKTSEDTAKIVPFPANVWSGEAPQRFTAMMTQVTGAATTAADMSSVLSLYYGQLADTAASFNGLLKSLAARFKACESQIKDAEKHSGGWSIGGLVDAVDDFVSKSPEELRSTQRQIAASMADIHAEWQRLDSAMSSDIRNKYMPAFQAAMDMLPFKYKSAATITPTKPTTAISSIAAAEAAEAYRNSKVSEKAPTGPLSSGSIRAIEEADRLRMEQEKRREGLEAQDNAITSQPGGGVYVPGVGSFSPTVRSTLGLPEIKPSTVATPGSWPVVKGDSWWKVAETTLRNDYNIDPTPSQINGYLNELRAHNPSLAGKSLIQGVVTIVTPAPSFISGVPAPRQAAPTTTTTTVPSSSSTGPTGPSPDADRLAAEAGLPDSIQITPPAPAGPAHNGASPDADRLAAEAKLPDSFQVTQPTPAAPAHNGASPDADRLAAEAQFGLGTSSP